MHKTAKPVAWGTAMTGVFITLCWLVVRFGLDFQMLAWATNVAALLLFVFLFRALEGEVGDLDRAEIGGTVLKSSLAVAPPAVLVFLLTLVLPIGKSKALDAALLLGLGAAGFAAFFGGCLLLRLPEVSYLDRFLQKLRRRGSSSSA